MKKVTRFFSLLLAIAMVLAMNLGTLTVSAGNGGSYTITIKDSAEGHVYEAYQIFTGTLGTSGNALGDIEWGAGIKSDDFLTALKASTVTVTIDDPDTPGSTKDVTVGSLFTSCTTAQDVADVLEAYNDNTTLAKEFADIAGKNLGTVAGASTETSGTTYTITGLTAGYYLVKDKDNSLSGDDAYTDFILQVVKDTEATPKSDKPTVEKKVADINDSESTTAGSYQDSADYDIGDDVPFQLTATVASNYADYTEYVLTFHDTQSPGLTFNNDVTVTLDGQTLDSSNYVVTYDASNAQSDGCTFEVKVTLKTSSSATAATAGSTVVVSYTSELNENAVIGTAGNPNEVILEYSNNPNNTTDTGKTPKDKVIVFTFELDVNKVDSDGQALAGAAFTLYKFVAGDTTDEITFDGVSGSWVENTTTYTAGNTTKFEFKGLDDGYYKIVETTTPSGYNSISDIYIQVTAEHDTTADDPTLTELKVSYLTVTESSADIYTVSVDSSKTAIDATSTLIASMDVENLTGAELPSTGGMGTKIFYTLGGVLVLGAGVLLIVKRRMRNA